MQGELQTNKSAVSIAQNDAFEFHNDHRSDQNEVRFSHVHARTAILYSEASLRGAHSPVSIWKAEAVHCELTLDTVRFFVWWLFLHRRLRFRQRGSASEDASDWAPFELIISRWRHSFLSEWPRDPKTSWLSLSASAPSVPSNWFSASVALERSVTASVPPLGAGQNARKRFRLYSHLTA